MLAVTGDRGPLGLFKGTSAAPVRRKSHFEFPVMNKFVGRFVCTITAAIVVNDYLSAVADLGVQGVQTAFGRFIPISVNSKQSDRPNTVCVDRQRILKPPLDQSDTVTSKTKPVKKEL